MKTEFYCFVIKNNFYPKPVMYISPNDMPKPTHPSPIITPLSSCHQTFPVISCAVINFLTHVVNFNQ